MTRIPDRDESIISEAPSDPEQRYGMPGFIDPSEGSPAVEFAARRSTWVSAGVNVGLSSLQMAVGWFAGSQALIADGIHSLSDLLADFAVLIATRYGSKAADVDHPYGHQRAENAASLFLGLLLLAVGAGMVINGIGRLQHLDTIATVGMPALYVAIAALVIKESLFRYMLAVAKRVRSALLVANAWHARSDAASSLVVGLGIIGNLLGYRMLDPIAGMIVGLIVCKMGGEFAYEALHDLMDRAGEEQDNQSILDTILAVPGVLGAHGLRTRKMGDLLLVDVHIEIDGGKSVHEGHDIALQAREQVLKNHRVINVMTHVDPV